MPQLTRNWYFQPWPVDAGSDPDNDSAPGLTCVPFALLQRHGARVLDPNTAATIPHVTGAPEGWSRPPRSTVYRARTLLIPPSLLGNRDAVRAINTVLASVGMEIAVPDQDRVPAALLDLPRVVVLVPAGPVPVTVDAWTALQALRASVGPSAQGDKGDPSADPTVTAGGGASLSVKDVRGISLEHLLVGSAITGSPSSEGNGISGSPSSEGNGLTGPGGTDSYGYSGGDTRAPVTLCLPAPARAEPREGDPRRPVVAVLDTGVRAHPWLDVRANPNPPNPPNPPDPYVTDLGIGFVQVDPDMQTLIEASSAAAAGSGDQPRVPIRGPWDTPVSGDPLLGELNDASGHGTFISGIVRQVAPDAQVLSIRIMHSDDIVYEGDLLCALALLAARIAAAEAGDMTGMVDVVSLSLGYFDESAADVCYSSALWQVIRKLLGLGVAVVAAAGNYSTSRRFFPAAFSLQPPPSPFPVIAAGALNPNGSRALFSDGGRWVWAWAAGAAVVSTFPDDINGSRTPEVRVRPHPDNGTPPVAGLRGEREALDPDDYHGGFAVWSGTSFSAPLIAALLAAKLLENAARPALGLGEMGPEAAASRITAALTDMGAAAGAAPGAATPAAVPTGTTPTSNEQG